MNYPLFISCARGLEYLLENEVKSLGLSVTRVSPQGVFGDATLNVLYQLCLWSRLANRINLLLFTGQASDEKSIYRLCHQYAWHEVFSVEQSIAIEFHGTSAQIRNTMFGAQVIKDAIVDSFRDHCNQRPAVNRTLANIRLQAYFKYGQLTLSLDLTGYSLHQRGYRKQISEAPLKETLAAALLIRANWPALASQGYALYDPFCGSGTLVIEAALMATHTAPGLIREDQSIIHWRSHNADLWETLRQDARLQIKPLDNLLLGSDAESRLIEMAQSNAERAGVSAVVQFITRDLTHAHSDSLARKGLLVANPPYGERLDELTSLVPLYQQFGAIMHQHFQGWQAAFLTSNPLLAKAVGLRAHKQYRFYNGAIECKLYCLALDESNQRKDFSRNETLSPGATMLVNRLKKNLQHLKKWLKKESISCYRLYDADLPEYSYAIDVYNHYVILQEYKAPNTIPDYKIEKRSLEVLQAVPIALDIDSSQLIVKQRKPQKGANQYQKMQQTDKTIVVSEGQANFKINLYDYLDTGLFLDHRPLRLTFAELPAGTRFLNCFCYTASASVHAALAGAITTNVDLSATYLTWAQDNFKLNQLNPAAHYFIQADCTQWLKKQRERYDVIFLDPPSFSNSKRMSDTLDIQRDHSLLIEAAMRLLSASGTLYFSTNLRSFKLDPAITARYRVNDISAQTIDIDFQRNQRIHQCFVITSISN